MRDRSGSPLGPILIPSRFGRLVGFRGMFRAVWETAIAGSAAKAKSCVLRIADRPPAHPFSQIEYGCTAHGGIIDLSLWVHNDTGRFRCLNLRLVGFHVATFGYRLPIDLDGRSRAGCHLLDRGRTAGQSQPVGFADHCIARDLTDNFSYLTGTFSIAPQLCQERYALFRPTHYPLPVKVLGTTTIYG